MIWLLVFLVLSFLWLSGTIFAGYVMNVALWALLGAGCWASMVNKGVIFTPSIALGVAIVTFVPAFFLAWAPNIIRYNRRLKRGLR